MTRRRLIRGIRRLYALGAALALGAAFMTFVLTSKTGEYFAWPIEPELTAAAIGACYLAAVTLLSLSFRATTWADGRLAAVPVMSISLLLLAATLIHWDRFEQDHVVFWLWLAAYVLVPPVLLVLLVRQRREHGEDPPATSPLPQWLKVGLALQGAAMIAAGVILFLAPGLAEELWPWALTPLTSRALGAFSVGFGLTALVAIREADLRRVRAAALAFAVFGGAALIAVARYEDEFGLDLAGWLFLAFVATALLGGFLIAALGRGVSAGRADVVS